MAAYEPPQPAYERKVFDPDYRLLDVSRRTLLMIGIDIRGVVGDFLVELEGRHGRKRADIFREYIDGGRLYRFSPYHREKIRADCRLLSRRLREGGYRRKSY